MLRRSEPFFSGNAVLHLLLGGPNFRAAQSRGHFGGRRFIKRALAHCNFGNCFVDRSVPSVVSVCRRKDAFAPPSAAWRSRRSCCGAEVAIGPAHANALVLGCIPFRWPLFVVRAALSLPPGIPALTMFLAISETHASRPNIF
jgi:hypothetical protein